MTFTVRGTTAGNSPADNTKMRQSFSNVPPVIQATLRNAVPKNGTTPDRTDIAGQQTVNPYKLERLSNIISNNINAVTDLRSITPYIDKAELIWNTILLYPNGKQDKILTYDTLPSQYKSTAMHNELLKIWDEYFTNDYKIESDLGKIINDILWDTGSYTLFNLSRPGLDYLINGSEIDPKSQRSGTEQYEMYKARALNELQKEFVVDGGKVKVKNLGKFVRDPGAASKASVGGLEAILNGNITETGTEFNIFNGQKEKYKDGDTEKEFNLSDFIDITLTDNPACLYFQKLNEQKRAVNASEVMGAENLDLMINSVLQTEAEKPVDPIDEKDTHRKPRGAKKVEATTQNLNEHQIADMARDLYPNRNIRHQSMQFVKPIDTLSVAPYGRGLTWHIPSEAVIPIHYNGQNKRQGDFIFLIDPEDGTFLKNTSDPEYYQSTAKNKAGIANKNKAGSENHLISSLRLIQEGKECEFDMTEFVELAKQSVIRQFTSSIFSNKADSISITIDEETNKIFMARMFRRQGIRALYVPGEAVTYMALKYSRLGTGQSLTQTAKMHIARLAAYDVADTLANLEAAQPHTLMTITHGKEDGDPNNTVAIARAAFFDQNPKLHSLMSSAQLSIPTIVDALKDSALTVKVNAGENALVAAPDIEMQQSDKNFFKPVSDESRQKVMNDIANYLFTPRSWLDVSDDTNNFKIEAITEHQMVTNQAVNWQSELADFIVDFMKKHVRVNGPLLQRLVECIKDNKKHWKPDNAKQAIEGDDATVIKIILADFFTSLFVSFPEPTNLETTDKLKNQLDAVKDLVDKWMDIAASTEVLKGIAESLGITDTVANGDDIVKHVRSYFYYEAFKRYNIPMPFDDIVNDGKGGGIASLVHGIIHQRMNTQEFFVQYVTEVKKESEKFLKANKSKLDKLFEAQAEEPPVDGGLPNEDGSVPGAEGESTGDPELDGILNAGDQPAGADDGSQPPAEETDQPEEPGAAESEETEESEPAAAKAEGEETEEEEDSSKGSTDPSSPNYDPFMGGKA